MGIKLVVTIKATDPFMKGAHAAASMKSAELTNGAFVKVPQHVDVGDKIVVNVEDTPPSYVSIHSKSE